MDNDEIKEHFRKIDLSMQEIGRTLKRVEKVKNNYSSKLIIVLKKVIERNYCSPKIPTFETKLEELGYYIRVIRFLFDEIHVEVDTDYYVVMQ